MPLSDQDTSSSAPKKGKEEEDESLTKQEKLRRTLNGEDDEDA